MNPDIPAHLKIDFHPCADPRAVVSTPHARFSVLTSRLIRMETSPIGVFEDRPSQAFWYREQPVPEFQVERTGSRIEIRTEHLRLVYDPALLGQDPAAAGFGANALWVEVFATGKTWHYGMQRDRANLRGTARTLDGADGFTPLEKGLMSRDGWAVVDDSATLVFDEESWIAQRAHPENCDLYFFGYGHDYLGCLRDYCALTGQVPLVPRWALGNWWSRYWEYSEESYLQLMDEFRQNEIPLTVCVIDMDWHITRTGNTSSGWTGYTWNRQLFPDPARFLRALKDQGMKATLNVHPAEGVHPHEEMYAEMAGRLGIDPQSKNPVAFDIPEPKFAKAYFEVLHHPQEARGIDFWWIDWQQGERTKMPGLDPLYWLNHLHFYDLARDGRRRPFIFSRWGGLGSHRYTIGFSGDTVTSWASLAFQPYFTATASNVAYSWWSHDIGGHMRGLRDGELYARWVQYGVFTPILRLHSTKTFYHDRRPWAYDAEVLRVSRAALQLRYALIPYLYSMAWRNHVESRPLIQPMYYSHPEEDSAYQTRNQYWYGTELIAAPYITPRDPDTRLSSQAVWLPEGDWFDFFSGEHLPGGRWQTFYGALEDTPVIAKAGAIVPLGPRAGWGNFANPTELDVHLFPGADNAFVLYEDDGESEDYHQGHSCRTPLAQRWGGNSLEFTLGPAEGETDLVPARREVRLRLHGVSRPDRVEVRLNGAELGLPAPEGVAAAAQPALQYNEAREELALSPVTVAPADRLEVTFSVKAGSLLGRRDRRPEKVRKLLWNFLVSDVNTCQELDDRVDELLAGRLPLELFANRLKGAQLDALRNTIQ